MNINHFFYLCALGVLLTSPLGCAKVRATEPSVVALSPMEAGRGETIYFGRVFPLEGRQSQPTYVYERRVQQTARGNVSTHITRDPNGAVILADRATHRDDYTLIDYTLLGNQLGQRGVIRVDGAELWFQLDDVDGQRTRMEPYDKSVVVGPTLVGTIVRHLEALRGGSVLPVRLALLDRLETLAFELEAVGASGAETRVRMQPSNLLLSAVIDPVVFTFESDTGKLVRLEGRVPPKRRDGEWLKDFDARVEYSFVTAEYL